ncbi:hypothetical protein HFP15_35370 [Amycolatopsis sp. K13G38]|uniref:Serine/threonine protein kinase n=1 Tax=Amycolatopsis acididurans TaxID=2724524 RepID=A0ABX1JEC7_9PSEU|nr:hypothetical protein [Amycolatopsis acididurans]NKQ58153.1 hypothetical protein [Amycolatopsis acididurans]
MRGSLPIGPLGDNSPSAFPAASGELPVPPPAPKRPSRQKVTLTPPTCHEETPDDEDVRVYVAPPETGLSTFDLGSVPASVTPPRSWRKAAWFATASSGGVVVALLFAGSALVGKPSPDQAGGGWIPGLGGGIPTIGGEQIAPGPAGGGRPDGLARTSDGTTSLQELTSTDSSRQSTGRHQQAPDSTTSPGHGTATSGSPSGGDSSSAPTTTPVPQKPPPTPAPYDADPNKFAWPQGDPATFAKDSQKYLDTVTQDPQAASAMTTGELSDEGPQGLKRKYSDVAYFEVEHVQVHQYDGKTVCTVKKVGKDGSETTEQKTITFQNGKISSDGS